MNLSPFQTATLQFFMEGFSLALPGGKGSGKTKVASICVVEHCKQHRKHANALIFRKSKDALEDLFNEVLSLILSEDPKAESNRNKLTIRCFEGATISFSQLIDEKSIQKLSGRSRTLIIGDELHTYSSFALIQRVLGDLRSADVPTQMIMLANPNGPGAVEYKKLFITDRKTGMPYEALAHQFVTLHSNFRDNPALPGSYEQTLRAAAGGNEQLEKMILDGDWNVSVGLMFPHGEHNYCSLNLDYVRELVDKRLVLPALAADWGMSSPSCCLLGLQALRPIPVPKGDINIDIRNALNAESYAQPGSVLFIDECTDWIPDPQGLNQDRSEEWTPSELVDGIGNMVEHWGLGMLPIVIDSLRGLDNATVLDVFQKSGFFAHANLPVKGKRAPGWAVVRNAIHQSKVNGTGIRMYLDPENCPYLELFLSRAVMDEKRFGDVQSSKEFPCHPGDAARYFFTSRDRLDRRIRCRQTVGHY